MRPDLRKLRLLGAPANYSLTGDKLEIITNPGTDLWHRTYYGFRANNGYSDWASADIDSTIRSMYYRPGRRENDFCIEHSQDGKTFQQMRICHLFGANGSIPFGIHACSPEDSSFRAEFDDFSPGECQWRPHRRFFRNAAKWPGATRLAIKRTKTG